MEATTNTQDAEANRLTIMEERSTSQPWTIQYVLTLLVTVFCSAIPCSYIGLALFLSARNSYDVGHGTLSEKKRKQAICWTAWAFGLGLLQLIVLIVIVIVLAEELQI